MIDLEVFTTVAIVALVFVPLEALLPARGRPEFSLARYRTDLLHALLGGLVIRAGTVALIAVLLLPAHGVPSTALDWPIWLQFVAVLLISDLMFWLAHRLYHAVPLLWKFHRVHHSSEHLDWLAAFRVHPVDQIVNASIIALPTMVLGFSPVALLIYALLYKWHAILLHSNVDVSFGPLGWVVTTPRFHHWHHANQVEAYDRNFGGQLAIWDRLFGTAYQSEQPRPERYGVDDPPPENFVSHMVLPFLPGKQ